MVVDVPPRWLQLWAEIVIDRPDRRNSLIPPLFTEITDALKQLEENDDVAAVVLRGDGGYFCSGIDRLTLLTYFRPFILLLHYLFSVTLYICSLLIQTVVFRKVLIA